MNLSLRHLRVRLTVWFTAANVAIFLVLGAGLLWAISRELARELERDLESTVTESIRGARILAADGTSAPAAAVQSAAEFRTPIRPVLVYAPDGSLMDGGPVSRADSVARAARETGHADGRFVAEDGATWWAHAQRFQVGDGGPFVELALGSSEPLKRQYRRMVGAFIAAGLVAVMLAGGGGYRLSRISTAPVEESMERTRRLMADIAHELRTPLAVVRAQVDVSLRHERQGADYVATLRTVGREAERLGLITDDLLLLARADAGQRPVALEPLFLDDVVSDAVSAARALAESRGVVVGLDRYDESPVAGDSELLRRLVMILLDNAIHHTPGGRRVTVDVYAEAPHAVLVVRDEGEGIPTEALDHVFDRFYRADAAWGRVGGAGLGLSIARWIATEHHGTLTLESSPGEGVRALYRMPLRS